MYNGIGLQTARGSGTNGYVQTNKFFVRPKTGRVAGNSKGFEDDQGTAGVSKRANKDILEHDRKRQIELKLVMLEDKLVDQGYTDAEIAEKLEEARSTLLAAAASEASGGAVVSNEKVSDTQTHQVAARKEKQMETLRAALGITVCGPDDALELEPGEIKDDQPKKSKKHGRNEGANEPEKSNVSLDDEDEPKAKEIIKEKKLEVRHRSKKYESSSSDSGSERETERRAKNKSKNRKHKRSSYDSSETDTDSDGKIAKRSSKKSKRSRKDTDSDSDSDPAKKHNSKQRRRRYDFSDTDSAEKQKKSRKKTKRVLKDSKSDSGSDESDSFDDSSDTDSAEGKKRHVPKHPAHSNGIQKVEKLENRTQRLSKQISHKDDSSSEPESDERVASKRKKQTAQQKRHETDESDSDTADDGDVKRRVRAKKHGNNYADDITDGDVRQRNSYKEEESRWENKRSEEIPIRSWHSADSDPYKQREYNKYENLNPRDRNRHQEDISESKHDRYKGTQDQKSDRYKVDEINEERYDPRSEREVSGKGQSDPHELHTETRRSDRHEESRDRRHGSRYDDGSDKTNKDRQVVKDLAYYGDHEKDMNRDHGMKSKRDEDYGRARLGKEDENPQITRKTHTREEEKKKGSRRHERSRDADSPKRARYNDDSPSDEKRKDTGRHARSRR